MAWRFVCQPKECGGLGFKELLSWNKALMFQWVHDFSTNNQHFVLLQWIHKYKLQYTDIWQVQGKATDSNWWLKLFQITDEVYNAMAPETLQALLLEPINRKTQGVYDCFSPLAPLKPWLELVWNQFHVPKTSFISWLACLNRLQTKDIVLRFNT